MKHLHRLWLLSVSLLLIIPGAQSQSVEDFLERYTGDDAEGYVQPLSDALGSSMNSGWFHTSFVRKKGFQLYFGIVSQTALIPDKKKTYQASLPDFFTPQTPAETVTAPTIMGAPQNVIVPGTNGTEYTLPGGAGVSMVPIGVPQLTIGSLYGTDASFRFFAFDWGGDVGKMDLFGWGIRHSISQYFNNLPVHLAVGYYSTSFELSDNLESTHQLVSLQGSYFVGKSGVFEIYGGLGFETGSFEFSYFSSTEDIDVTLDLDPSNSMRFTLGANLNLGAFTLNADYNLAEQSALAVGIGVGFGKKKRTE